MAKIRAYKLAEELGLDRVEFVEKAAAAGIELKSAMASIDEEVAQELREKLGGGKRDDTIVTERRVLGSSGGAVIRRRRKAAAPKPEPAAEEPPPPEPAAVEAEPALEPIAAEAESVQPVEEEPAAPVESEPVVEPIAARAAPPSEEPAASQPSQRSEPTPPMPERPAGPDKSGKQRKLVREVVNLREQERLARQAVGRSPLRRHITVDPRSVQSPRRRRRDAPAKPAAKAEPKPAQRVVRIEGTVSVGELARMLGAKGPDVQRKLMALGTMVSINQSLDAETATKVAAEYGYELQDVGFDEQEFIEAPDVAEDDASLAPRPPVITVMGHVDHGKTSLLDAIRKANVVAGEAGGITQHIGAYRTSVDGHPLTFIDTPGHAAFTEMRARGASITDLVILVVAGTEGIMPQTIEAIEHSKAAGVPIVVAVNKMDLPGANSQQTRQRLMEHGLVPEDFGGDTICVDVSATTGAGLDKLLEMIQLQAELLELKADPNRRAAGVVIEGALDKGRGPVATILVQAGTLKRGDIVVVGTAWGRIRAMEDENGVRLKEAGPSVPVQITGLSSVPEAGQLLNAVESERVAKEIIAHREAEARETPRAARSMLSLDEIFARAEGGGVKELPVVIKADAQGSVEALRDALLKLSTDAVKVDVLLAGVGAVTETDVMLAKASNAIIVAFHVRPDPAARKAAESQGVEIRAYRVIYEVLDEIKQAMAGLLPPTVSEAFQGRAEVRETFTVPKVGTIAGCYVVEGNVRRGASCRLLRDGVQIYEGRVGSLKRFKDDVREVATGFECGIGIEGYNDVKIGDVIETYVLEEKPATLE
jgi:translation initiation factor IF-2